MYLFIYKIAQILDRYFIFLSNEVIKSLLFKSLFVERDAQTQHAGDAHTTVISLFLSLSPDR